MGAIEDHSEGARAGQAEAERRAREELDARLPRSRFARMRDIGEDRLLELPLEENGNARLEFHLGHRGGGGTLELRQFDYAGRHTANRITEEDLRAIALTATAALGWMARPPE